MKKSTYFNELGATASCLLRAAQAVTCRLGINNKPNEIAMGDSWFGLAMAAVALTKKGFECIFQVKNNHSLFPKKEIESILQDAPGGRGFCGHAN